MDNKNNSVNTVPSTEKSPELSFAATEAYKLLRTNLTFSFPDSENGKVIGVSSAVPNEGKSLTSLNLATSFAEAGSNVLLIDCDMRKPSLMTKLDMSCAPGLSNLLVNNERNVIHSGVRNENLSVITAGEIPPNPSELLGSENMKAVLELFRQHFDYIILDLPPVTVVPDPLVVSKYTDGIVLVVHHETTKRRDIMEAIRQLKMSGVRLLGFVYNGYRSGSSSGYKSYSYGNYKKTSGK